MSAVARRPVLPGAARIADGAMLLIAAWGLLRIARRRTDAPDGRVVCPERLDRAEPGRGRAARWPVQIPPRGWLDIVWRVYQGFNRNQLMFVAGGVTFFTLLALFPALTAFVSLYGLFADPETASAPLHYLEGLLPSGVVAFLADQMQRLATRPAHTLGLAFLGSTVLSLWSANASVKALIYGLNVAYHETEKRNFLRYNLLTMAFTVGFLTFLLFVSGLVVLAPLVSSWIGWDLTLRGLAPLRWPVLIAVYVGVVGALYRYGPCRQQARWRWLTWGGTFAASLSLGASWLFSWWLSSFARFDAAYGPLSALMGFMVWTWWSVTAILLGASLNAEMEHQTARDTTTGPELPMGNRGALVADTLGPRRGSRKADDYTLEHAREWARRRLMKRGRTL